MKIAIINSSAAIAPGGGVRVQGIMWYQGLKKLGHDCTLINMWDDNDWTSYDFIIILDMGEMLSGLLRNLPLINKNIVVAPIIDPAWSKPYISSSQSIGDLRNILDCHLVSMISIFMDVMPNCI